MSNKSREKEKTVAVLMSTFNGEKHINAQIDSILSQLGPADQLIIRDDGSSDKTLDLIREFDDHRIVILCGSNLGFANSFFHILYHVDLHHSMYMLADQDDIWLPGKIDRSFDSLSLKEEPCLYCTRLQLVHENLSTIGQSPFIGKRPGFRNAVCENIATGCTIALNKAAMEIIRSVPLEKLKKGEIHYHDWWLYLNISHAGTVIWDSTPSILYRQHGANMVGMGSGIGRYTKIWKSVRKRSWVRIMVIQLRAFINLREKSLSAVDIEWIESLCKGSPFKIAWNLVADEKLYRQQPMDKFLFRALVAFDYFRGCLRSLP